MAGDFQAYPLRVASVQGLLASIARCPHKRSRGHPATRAPDGIGSEGWGAASEDNASPPRSVAPAIGKLLTISHRATQHLRLGHFKRSFMPPFQTDRQVVERLIVPAMAAAVITIMKKELERDLGGESPDLNTAHDLLQEAMKEPVSELPPDRVGKIIRRAKRGAVAVLKENFERPLALQYLIIAHWVMGMTERGFICVGAASPFAQAWDIMADVLGALDDKFDALAEEAAAGAIKLGEALRREGLFQEAA